MLVRVFNIIFNWKHQIALFAKCSFKYWLFTFWHAQASKGPNVERQIWQNNISTRIPVKRLKIFLVFGRPVRMWPLGIMTVYKHKLRIDCFSKNRHRENSILSCKWRTGNARPQMKTDFPLIFQLVSPAKQLSEELLRFNQYLIIIAFVQLTLL